MRIAARYADEFNVIVSATRRRSPSGFAKLDEAGPGDRARPGDDPALGDGRARSSAATRRRWTARRQALLAEFGLADDGDDMVRHARGPRWIFGTPDEARAMVARFAAAGVERLMLQDFLPWDLEMIDLLGEVLVRA